VGSFGGYGDLRIGLSRLRRIDSPGSSAARRASLADAKYAGRRPCCRRTTSSTRGPARPWTSWDSTCMASSSKALYGFSRVGWYAHHWSVMKRVDRIADAPVATSRISGAKCYAASLPLLSPLAPSLSADHAIARWRQSSRRLALPPEPAFRRSTGLCWPWCLAHGSDSWQAAESRLSTLWPCKLDGGAGLPALAGMARNPAGLRAGQPSSTRGGPDLRMTQAAAADRPSHRRTENPDPPGPANGLGSVVLTRGSFTDPGPFSLDSVAAAVASHDRLCW